MAVDALWDCECVIFLLELAVVVLVDLTVGFVRDDGTANGAVVVVVGCFLNLLEDSLESALLLLVRAVLSGAESELSSFCLRLDLAVALSPALRLGEDDGWSFWIGC